MPDYEHVNHPPHYGGEEDPFEAIKVIEAWDLGFCLGNTVKYIRRAGRKPKITDADTALQDLEKAAWYLNREIEQRKAALTEAEAERRKREPCGAPYLGGYLHGERVYCTLPKDHGGDTHSDGNKDFSWSLTRSEKSELSPRQ